MNCILVLTDFSEAALHAAHYACALSRQLQNKKLIFYHSYTVILPFPGTASVIEKDNDAIQNASKEAMEELLAGLKDLIPDDTITATMIEPAMDTTTLAVSANTIAEKYNADMVVMGITGKGSAEQVLAGSNTMRVARECRCPVLIIPPGAPIEPVLRIVFACDLQKVTETTPVMELKKLLDNFKAPLMVVNVEHKGKDFTSEMSTNASSLYLLLETYQPAFHYVNNVDTVAGITEFAVSNKASLIIMIPRSHGFFEGLFHRSVSRKLAYHTSIPLLLVQEKAI